MTSILKTIDLTLEVSPTLSYENLNITIRPGEIWGILGKNGCGKTTLLHTLSGFCSAKKGEIYLQQKKLSTYPPRERAIQLGVLFQTQSTPFPQTVFEFCMSGRYPHCRSLFSKEIHHETHVQTLLTDFELIDRANQSIHSLSGGEFKRLQIATLLAQSPHVYLLDEPLNHLDIHYQIKTLRYFKHLIKQQSKAMVFSLHDSRLASTYCDQLIILQPGRSAIIDKTRNALTEEVLRATYDHPFQVATLSDSDKTPIWLPEF